MKEEKPTIKTTVIDKLNDEVIADLSRIWFTADLHHGHDKIVNICNRPCSELKHEDWLVDTFNYYVKRKHVTYFIGDTSFSRKPDAERFLDRLNGEKFCIMGNHDKNIHASTRFTQITQIKDFTYSKYGLNLHIVLCHYPFVSWNRKPHGSWHLHGLPWNLYGHVHGRFNNEGLSIDVGIDNLEMYKGFDGNMYTSYHKPLNLYEVIQIFAEREKTLLEENEVR